MTRILLTNDDGISAPGIAALRLALDGLGDVTTIAPDRNTSAVARGITITRPLRLTATTFAAGWPGTAVDGTPSDCVRVGLLGLHGEAPELVVSGVNHGANLGVDVTYSGTVGAALEAALRGLPAIAFSAESHEPRWLHEAHGLLRTIVRQTLAHGLPPRTALNVNLPDRPIAEIRGVRVARLGGPGCHDRILIGHNGKAPAVGAMVTVEGGVLEAATAGVDERDENDVREYELPCDEETAPGWAGTDVEALRQGYVSLTPLTYDLVADTAVELLSSWDLDMDVLSSGDR
jgi:5'-nucleotidase